MSINITGNRVFQQGEATAITCSTPVPVQSIQWLDESNSVVVNESSVQELAFNLSIRGCKASTAYVCRIIDGSFTESQNITIEVAVSCSNSVAVGISVGLILAVVVAVMATIFM